MCNWHGKENGDLLLSVRLLSYRKQSHAILLIQLFSPFPLFTRKQHTLTNKPRQSLRLKRHRDVHTRRKKIHKSEKTQLTYFKSN